MAKELIPTRDYNFADGTLQQLGDAYVLLATRDAADFAGYGMDAATITDLQDKIDAFADHPTDEEKLGELIGFTDDKNEKRDQLETALRSMLSRAINKYGEKHNKVTRFGIGAISGEPDDILVRTASRAARVATLLQAELVTEGVTVAYIDTLKALALSFNTAIDEQTDAIWERDQFTRQRVAFGNDLYKAIVKISNYGKDCYYTKNEAKYNDYLISEQATEIGAQRTGTIANPEKKNLDFPGIEATHTFRIKVPGGKADFYFSATTTGDPVGAVLSLQTGADETRTALQLGWTELTPFFMIRNVDGPSDTTYEVYRVG